MLVRLRGLRVQLLLWAIVPLTVIVVGISAVGLYGHRTTVRDMVSDRDSDLAQVAARLFDARLDLHAHLVESLASVSSLPDLPEFDGGLFILGANGQITPASAQAKAASSDNALSQLLDASVRLMDHSRISLPFDDPVSHEQVVLFSAPVAGGESLLGLTSMKQLEFPAVLHSLGIGAHSLAYVTDSRGNITYRLTEVPDAVATGRATTSANVGISDTDAGTSFHTGPDGQEWVVSYALLPTAGWGLVIEEPWADSVTPFMQISWVTPLVLALTMLQALIVILFGRRYIIKPLQKLEQAARRVAQGDAEAIREPVNGVEEINSLQETLNQMTIQIRSYQTALRGYVSALTHAEEAERRHVARELHDDTVQTLIALMQRLERCEIADSPHARVCAFDDVRALATQAMDSIRRLIQNLRPPYLDDLGLVAAVEAQAQDMARNDGAPRVNVDIRGKPIRLESDEELAVFRICQEALSNVLRHAQASAVSVRLEFGEQTLTLTVQDDGRGFSVPSSPQDAAREGHFGLLGMRERATRMGGHLSVSSQPGQGALFVVTIPYHQSPSTVTSLAPQNERVATRDLFPLPGPIIDRQNTSSEVSPRSGPPAV